MRKLVDQEDLINWWLTKYHNTNLKKVEEDHFEWKVAEKQYNDMKNHRGEYTKEQQKTICENVGRVSRDFYSSYMVTQEQHDEWEKWAKEYTKKVTGIKGKLFDRSWWSVYLNTSPSVINTKNNEKENNEYVS